MVSINDRLGSLIERFHCREAGQNIAPLSDSWISEILYTAMEESDSMKKIEDYKPSTVFDEVF